MSPPSLSTMTNSRFNRVGIFAGLAIVLLFAFLWRSGAGDDAMQRIRRPKASFYDIGTVYGTDKVSTHSYHHMYQKYLEPIRNDRLKVLEIGLGCDMPYGPGASVHAWNEYLPHVDLYVIEYDAPCAEAFSANSSSHATIYAGDQSDRQFLARFMRETGPEPFDVIVDDGGHTMTQQITSLEVLFRAVRPGGVYFCEDLQTSYDARYGGGVDSPPGTMIQYVKDILDDLNAPKVMAGPQPLKHSVSADIQSVECMEEICAFFKKDA